MARTEVEVGDWDRSSASVLISIRSIPTKRSRISGCVEGMAVSRSLAVSWNFRAVRVEIPSR
ncbi:MAG: hypothetical protein QMB94_05135, partial [Phycisphaerales bacterium]